VKSIPLHFEEEMKWSKVSPFLQKFNLKIDCTYFRNRRGRLKDTNPPMIIQMLIENAINTEFHNWANTAVFFTVEN
jgi:LytS/YehU family sensor histidine kinase